MEVFFEPGHSLTYKNRPFHESRFLEEDFLDQGLEASEFFEDFVGGADVGVGFVAIYGNI